MIDLRLQPLLSSLKHHIQLKETANVHRAMRQSQLVAAGKINFTMSFSAQELISLFQMWFIFKLYSFHIQPTHFSRQFILWNYRSLSVCLDDQTQKATEEDFWIA